MGTVSCHFLVDQGFRLTTRFLRPYSNAEAAYDSKKRYFNYKMNSARRVVENYFGILAGRFRLLLRRVHGTPEHIKDIVRVPDDSPQPSGGCYRWRHCCWSLFY
ncbi:hypothetical protein Q1695_002690 [Nippostrongylus brasiliensis]|nr:hypothetical protein Q1695_002690 [Nippostrongylus brasiliensis]